ncbi:DNA-binding transcriptional regulator, LysR family [Bradyrhizobium canariense]|uniref:DNA-binding transcriptional regulator, LysR family n=2 Tax=Bradyrhizobium canariense TaxID=255045 RepID=A0A1H1SN28_9BRAD|nr:DNA-binding transcriptional regulator, LysR family [Bradyrhizobium canariense]
MPILDIDALRTFVSVVDQGSFAAAAGRVYRTQAAVTQRIQRLEANIGRPLLRKVGRAKRLTDDGVTLLDYARRILALHDEACASLVGTKVTGEIRLGAPDDASETILPGMLRRFATMFPEVRVVIHIARSAFLMQSLKQGEIDMAISTRDDPSHPRLRLRTAPTFWLSAAEFKLVRNEPVPLVMHDEPSLFRSIALDALEKAHIPMRLTHISGSLSGIRAAVRAGLGITARSIETLEPTFRVLGTADGLPPLPDVSLYLYLATLNAHPTARQLFDSLRDSFGEPD